MHCTAERVALARADVIADRLLVAEGTSCRHQIHDGGGRVARVLERALP